MYRFRKVENLIGKYQELEKQEIYFSDIDSLNDPMEGSRAFYWSGDIIVWQNLFKHYILCLEHMCALAYLSNDDKLLSVEDIPIFAYEENLPTDRYKQMFYEICEKFFENEGMNEYIEIISALPWKISRNELYSYLKSVHFLAFEAIMDTYIKYGLQEPPKTQPPDYSSHFKKIIEVWKQVNLDTKEEQEKIRTILEMQKDLLLEVDLISAYKLYDSPLNQRRWFILYEFTNAYLNKMEKLTYPEAYVACFMKDCTNAAVWGHYGDSHKGVCLKFRVKDKESAPSINLNCITGWSSKPIYSYRPFIFREIDYTNKFPSTNFFESIGRLPIGQLTKQWYTDEEGNISQYAEHMKDKNAQEDWRRQYWNNYDSCFFIKLKDWEYEKEQRLLLSSVLDSFKDIQDRKLKYKFEDLEAIIFGMKTSIEDKIKIIKIIGEKCKENNRKEFDFYQANYSQYAGKMEIKKLNFIKFDF